MRGCGAEGPYGDVVDRDEGDDEEVLAGGNASARVVRVGRTVRKPWLPTTERTVSYLRVLRQRGVDVPDSYGRDDQGRLILEFVPGTLAMDEAPLDVEGVRAAGALVRSIHDASVGLEIPADWNVLIPTSHPDLLCHNDLATWNLIIDGDRFVFIDWDGAGPSTRLWDFAYAAISFGHLFPGADVRASAFRLAAFVDGYGADQDLRAALPTAMAKRAHAMHDLLQRSHETGREPWGTMYAKGHGQHWLGTTELITNHHSEWRRALTFAPETH